MVGSFYGERGTLIGEGIFALAISRQAGTELEPLPVPQRLLDALPHVGDDIQSKWVALARDFVADIQGEPHDPYLTFRDGWRYQVRHRRHPPGGRLGPDAGIAGATTCQVSSPPQHVRSATGTNLTGLR